MKCITGFRAFSIFSEHRKFCLSGCRIVTITPIMIMFQAGPYTKISQKLQHISFSISLARAASHITKEMRLGCFSMATWTTQTTLGFC